MARRRSIRTASREFEEAFFKKNPSGLLAGIDEAGRGPLAGPVAIGIAVFPRSFFEQPVPEELLGLSDSKTIPEKRREGYADAIRRHALLSECVLVPAKIIDRLNINGAIEFAIIRAMKRAQLSGLAISHALIDGNYRFSDLASAFPETEFRSIKQGDSRVFSIAAASILAKTRRDRRMLRYEELFSGYGLARHKGYGTKTHREAIQALGPSPIHRRSYKW